MSVFGSLRDRLALSRGIRHFERTGETPSRAYRAMRRMYVRTRGRSLADLRARLERPAAPSAPGGRFAHWDRTTRAQVLDRLERDGCAVLPERLEPEFVARVLRFASETPCRFLRTTTTGAWSDERAPFDPTNPASSRYQFEPEQVLACAPAVELATDPSLAALAEAYLGAAAILDQITLWWSAPGYDQLREAAAQAYHFDLDRPNFLKVFVYVTDVTPDTGPHCYVRGSHRNLIDAVARDGRHTDESIHAAYGPEAELQICGPAGTVLLADTLGFHKGLPPTAGPRLMLQLEFTTSLFGAPLNRVPLERAPEALRASVGAGSMDWTGLIATRGGLPERA
ncbi:MAG: phytanoyl-CoA dioxygenase family protein [Planctomycetota bacterium]